jgi:Family of unknown function (DUF6266)
MAKTNGLFGKVSGKVASVVYASWKGIEYARQYVIPGNPNSTAQQAVRTKFQAAVSIAKSFLGSVIQPFIDPFTQKNSGFAHFIGQTMTAWASSIDLSLVPMVQGTLEPITDAAATYAGSTVTVTWDGTILGNGDAGDKACVAVYDVIHHVGFFNASAARSAESVGVTVGTGRSAAAMHVYVFMADSSTAPTVVSNTIYSTVS